MKAVTVLATVVGVLALHAQVACKPIDGGRTERDTGNETPKPAVAASVFINKNRDFANQNPLIFDEVITDIGGGYNRESGKFTAPVAGIYFVNYHAYSNVNSKKPAHLDLVKGEVVINSAKGIGASGTPSNSAVLHLKKDDMVYIRGYGGTAVGCANNRLCTLNIFLVQEWK